VCVNHPSNQARKQLAIKKHVKQVMGGTGQRPSMVQKQNMLRKTQTRTSLSVSTNQSTNQSSHIKHVNGQETASKFATLCKPSANNSK